MPRKVGRPPKLSVDQIVDAALEDGIGTFGMSSVARRLGVSHSGLYRYFDDYDALVTAAVARVLGSRTWPSTEGRPWRESLVAIGNSVWDMCDEVPGIDRTLLNFPHISDVGEKLYSETLKGLIDAGLTVEDAGIALEFITQLALTTSSHQDRAQSIAVHRQADSTTEPEVAKIANCIATSERGWYDQKVEIFLDGLAIRIEAEKGH